VHDKFVDEYPAILSGTSAPLGHWLRACPVMFTYRAS
jgi:hypothetical protein